VNLPRKQKSSELAGYSRQAPPWRPSHQAGVVFNTRKNKAA
jgi:hypothetical protein